MAIANDPKQLQGRVVLVKSTRDHRNPPTAMRGSIEIHTLPGSDPQIGIGVDFPQMFTTRAHHRFIPLDPPALERLVTSERDGALEFAIDDELV